MRGSHPTFRTRALGAFATAVLLALLAWALLLSPDVVVRSADAMPHLPQALAQWWPEASVP